MDSSRSKVYFCLNKTRDIIRGWCEERRGQLAVSRLDDAVDDVRDVVLVKLVVGHFFYGVDASSAAVGGAKVKL